MLWLVKWNYPTLQWASSLAEQPGSALHTLEYLGHHFALVAIPVAVGAALLLPWRRVLNEAAARQPDAFLVLVISTVLVFHAARRGARHGQLSAARLGQSAVLPRAADLAGARAAASSRAARSRAPAIVATAFTLILLIAAPIYPWVNYRLRPVGGPHAPYHEIADALTTIWHARFNTPLPIVVGGYEVAAYVVFYSGDHPKMYADFDPALSPWLDYPARAEGKGFVGACPTYATDCIARLDALNPAAEKLEVSVTRQIGDVKGDTMVYAVRVSPPR